MKKYLLAIIGIVMITFPIFASASSLTYWIKPNEYSYLHSRWIKSGVPTCKFTIGFYNGLIDWNVYDNGCGGSGDHAAQPSFSTVLGTWYKVTLDYTAGTYTLYIDDVSKGTAVASDIDLTNQVLSDENADPNCPFYVSSDSECSATDPNGGPEPEPGTVTWASTTAQYAEIDLGLAIIIVILMMMLTGFMYNNFKFGKQ